MSRLEGCRIKPLDSQECQTVVDWVTGGAEPLVGLDRLVWLLAHCRDGVTWGKFNGDSRSWRLSSTPFPDLSPKITELNLLEMRLFGPTEEVLIWHTRTGFSGRRLLDEQTQDQESPTKPDDEARILLGDRLVDDAKEGFTRVSTASGMEQAVPLECEEGDFTDGRQPLRFKVRYYFEQDAQTGAVRVAASRLVDVYKEIR